MSFLNTFRYLKWPNHRFNSSFTTMDGAIEDGNRLIEKGNEFGPIIEVLTFNNGILVWHRLNYDLLIPIFKHDRIGSLYQGNTLIFKKMLSAEEINFWTNWVIRNNNSKRLNNKSVLDWYVLHI